MESIINALYGRNLIDQTICDEMHDVRKLRNQFQHEDRGLNYFSGQAQMLFFGLLFFLFCIFGVLSNLANHAVYTHILSESPLRLVDPHIRSDPIKTASKSKSLRPAQYEAECLSGSEPGKEEEKNVEEGQSDENVEEGKRDDITTASKNETIQNTTKIAEENETSLTKGETSATITPRDNQTAKTTPNDITKTIEGESLSTLDTVTQTNKTVAPKDISSGAIST